MLAKNLLPLQKDIIDITLFYKASREYQFYKYGKNFTICQQDELKCPACACDCPEDPIHVAEKPVTTEDETVLHKKQYLKFLQQHLEFLQQYLELPQQHKHFWLR